MPYANPEEELALQRQLLQAGFAPGGMSSPLPNYSPAGPQGPPVPQQPPMGPPGPPQVLVGPITTGAPPPEQLPPPMPPAAPPRPPTFGDNVRAAMMEAQNRGLLNSPKSALAAATNTGLHRIVDPAFGRTMPAAPTGAPPGAPPGAGGQPSGAPIFFQGADPQMSGMARPQMVAAHEVSTIAPARAAAIRAAEWNVESAVEGQGKAGQELAAVEGEAAGERAKARDAEAVDIRERAAKNDAEGRRYTALMDKLSGQAGDMKLDPDKYSKDRSDGQAVLDALTGTLLGAYGALRGDPMRGIEMSMNLVNQRIDRSMASQRSEIEAKRGRIADMKGILADSFRMTGNMDQAEALARGLTYKGLEEKALAMTAGAKSKQIQANTDFAVADMRKKQAEEETRFYKYVPAGMVGGAGAGPMSKDKPLLFTGLDGKTYRAQTPESYNKITTTLGFTSALQSVINKGLAIRRSASDVDMLNPLSTPRKLLASLKAEAAQIKTGREAQGAMSKGDQEVADNAIGSLDGFMNNNNTVLEATRDRMGERMNLEIKATGAEEINRGYAPDAHGNIAPAPQYAGANAEPKPNAQPVQKNTDPSTWPGAGK